MSIMQCQNIDTLENSKWGLGRIQETKKWVAPHCKCLKGEYGMYFLLAPSEIIHTVMSTTLWNGCMDSVYLHCRFCWMKKSCIQLYITYKHLSNKYGICPMIHFAKAAERQHHEHVVSTDWSWWVGHRWYPHDAEDMGAGCQRLLDADDPDVLKCLLETTVHEAFGWCHPASKVHGSMVATWKQLIWKQLIPMVQRWALD